MWTVLANLTIMAGVSILYLVMSDFMEYFTGQAPL